MSASRPPFIVGLGGTVRPESTSETVLAKALAMAEASGARTELFGGAFLAALPVFNPEQREARPGLERLLAAVSAADGVIIASPGYHGSISGLVKNGLDSLEGLSGDARPYFDGRAVGCIVTAAGAQAGGSTLAALRSIVHALRGWPTPLGVTLNAQGLFDAFGEFADARDRRALAAMVAQVMDFARAFGAAGAPARESRRDAETVSSV